MLVFWRLPRRSSTAWRPILSCMMARVRDVYANVIGLLRAIVRLFFQRVTVTGLENVPAQGGGLVVAWHPNGLIDPVLIATSCPRRLTFGARDGLFQWPLLGSLMRAIGTVPIYRAADAGQGAPDEGRRARNRQSLDRLAQAIAEGSFSALFPEGVSHDAPHLTEIKVGAARLYYRAVELTPPGAPSPVILPVGLHYDDKHVFRSRALVAFHPPLRLPAELAQPPASGSDEALRARATALTAAVERALVDIVRPTESWQLHHLMHRTRTLLRAERAHRAGVRHDESDMDERELGFERVWRAYNMRRQSDPGPSAALLARVDIYDSALRGLGLRDDEIDADPRIVSPLLPALLLLQALFVYVLLPPILIAGYAINVTPYVLINVIAKRSAKLDKDLATVKLFAGLVLMPLAWLLFATLCALGVVQLHDLFPSVPDAPLSTAACGFALAAAGGFLALRYSELAAETWRALRVCFMRRRYAEALAHLREERAALHDAIEAMGEGIALPGRLSVDGRITP